MRRFLIIIVLSCVNHLVMAQSHITYEQVTTLDSAQSLKKTDITSYTASDGCTYSVGDQIIIGNKSGKLAYLYVAMHTKVLVGNRYGESVTISSISIGGNKRNGFYVKLGVRGLGIAGGKVFPFDLALLTGEILSNGASGEFNRTPEPEMSSKKMHVEPIQTYTTLTGDEIIAGETTIVFNPIFEKKYKYIKALPHLITGYSAKIESISFVTEKKQRRVEARCLMEGNNMPILVTSLDDALSLFEVSIKR